MSISANHKRIVVGICGASGAILGIELLKAMQQFPDWETHLVVSEGACKTISCETSYSLEQVAALASVRYSLRDFGAAIASGTFKTEGMIIVPCSMNTVASVANGICDNLLLRAADVTLKERRRLVLVARESPLSPTHLRNLRQASSVGAIILPPMLTFYNQPATIDDMVHHMVGKMLDVFELELSGFKRWRGVIA